MIKQLESEQGNLSQYTDQQERAVKQKAEFEAQLVHLLECMKYISTINSTFRKFFMNVDIDENWPRSLSPTEKN